MSENDIGFQAALEEARKGASEGGVPIGACLVSVRLIKDTTQESFLLCHRHDHGDSSCTSPLNLQDFADYSFSRQMARFW